MLQGARRSPAARVVSRPADQFHGDRGGGVVEPSGYTIWIATCIEDVALDALLRRAAAQHKG